MSGRGAQHGRAPRAPGKIITISSGAHASGRKGAAHYCASKAGVVMFTKVLAMELGPQKINVNCIAPGLVLVDRAGLDKSRRVRPAPS